ncbi:hypothetical protein [Stenotrophomonas sp. NPDC077659]
MASFPCSHVNTSRLVSWLAGDAEEAAQNNEELRALMESIGAPTSESG